MARSGAAGVFVLVPLLATLATAGAQEGDGSSFRPGDSNDFRRNLEAEGVPRADEVEAIEPRQRGLRSRVEVVYWPGGAERAVRAIEVIIGSPELPGLDRDVPDNVELYLAPDREVWDALTGGRVPEWGAGVAIPSLRRIVIPLFDAPQGGPFRRDRTVLHEWAHLGLHQDLVDLQVPRWFDEGYAQWASGGWDRGQAWRLRFALATGSSPPLDSLTLSFPGDEAGAGLAYLLSASAFEYLFQSSGTDGVEIMIRRWQDMRDFERAFRTTFGITTGAFEVLWIEHVRQQYSWVLVVYQSAVFWLLIGALIVLLVWIRRRRTSERLAGLRATEPPDRPTYWDEGAVL